MKKTIFKIFRICGYIIGFSVLFYPSISNYINQIHSTSLATNYEQEVSHIDEELETKMLEAARAYNESLIDGSILYDPFSEDASVTDDELYNSLLDINGTGMLGYIQIPKIDIVLPIYHGTSEAVLQSGVGHLENTSLPVGGVGSHAVLSGHRGLPSAKLFTDLNKMELGDIFYIKVLNNIFAYQVDQILTVEPSDTEALAIKEDEDYVTLVTCTPYAINTHRLLVRGTRIPYEEAVEVDEELELKPQIPIYTKALIIGAIALLIIYIIIKLLLKRKKDKRNDLES